MADTSRPMPARPPPSSEPSPLKTRYLTLYNLLSAVLWLTVFGRTVLLVPLVGYPNIYGGVGEFVKWTQTLAVMEILHSALGTNLPLQFFPFPPFPFSWAQYHKLNHREISFNFASPSHDSFDTISHV